MAGLEVALVEMDAVDVSLDAVEHRRVEGVHGSLRVRAGLQDAADFFRFEGGVVGIFIHRLHMFNSFICHKI